MLSISIWITDGYVIARESRISRLVAGIFTRTPPPLHGRRQVSVYLPPNATLLLLLLPLRHRDRSTWAGLSLFFRMPIEKHAGVDVTGVRVRGRRGRMSAWKMMPRRRRVGTHGWRIHGL